MCMQTHTHIRLNTFNFSSVKSGHTFRESYYTNPSHALILHTSILKISSFSAFLSVWQDSSSPHRQEPFWTAYLVETLNKPLKIQTGFNQQQEVQVLLLLLTKVHVLIFSGVYLLWICTAGIPDLFFSLTKVLVVIFSAIYLFLICSALEFLPHSTELSLKFDFKQHLESY